MGNGANADGSITTTDVKQGNQNRDYYNKPNREPPNRKPKQATQDGNLLI